MKQLSIGSWYAQVFRIGPHTTTRYGQPFAKREVHWDAPLRFGYLTDTVGPWRIQIAYSGPWRAWRKLRDAS